MDTGSSLNPSSLIDLKAELQKRYESFHREKVLQNSDSAKPTVLKRKGDSTPKEKKHIPIVRKVTEIDSEEDLALKKSRLALEAKAKIYDDITSNNILIDDEESERYVVDFNRKVLYGSPMPDVSNRTENKQNYSKVEEGTPVSDVPKYSSEMYSGKPVTSAGYNENISEEKQSDQPIHYQNVQFNEVRDHGTGYFAFSMDESKRKEQMEELNTLRHQTEEQRLVTQKVQKKRKAMLEARLAKVCERRNIDKSVVQTYTATQEAENVEVAGPTVDLSSIPLPETPEVPEKKEVKVRPWDIGKNTFTPFVIQKRKMKSQTDWVEERRSERLSEFAPPPAYL